MTKTCQIIANSIEARVVGLDREAKAMVSDKLSYMVAGHEQSEMFRTQRWDGRSSFFDWRTGTFPAGFAVRITRELMLRGWKVALNREPLWEPLGPEDFANFDGRGGDPRFDYQPRVTEALLRHGRMICQVATGGGKCLGRDTPVLMFDGTIKPVQDVRAGEQLMGPDSKPRTVLTTTIGVGPLFRVTPTKGDPYVVNDAHILSLKKTCRGYRGRNRQGAKYEKGEIVNINIRDYLAETATFRHTHKGWRTGVEFSAAVPLPVDPYFLGVLLGDGSIRDGAASVTTADPEILNEVKRQAALWGLNVRTWGATSSKAKTYALTAGHTGGKPNPLTLALRGLGLGENEKFIPHAYLTASRAGRLALLAGIVDTDGYYDGKGVYVTLKSERLLDGVIFLARSLGFAAYKNAVRKTCCNNGKTDTYFATVISGHLDQIPVRLERRKAKPRLQKKDHLVTGLKVEPIGEGEYFGFEIDGDHLFLLGDFTVTHNTRIAALAIHRLGLPTLFLTTRAVLLHQMKENLERVGIIPGIIGDGIMAPRKGVNLAMVQTLKARIEDERIRRLLGWFQFVIGEEAHEAGGDGYFDILNQCHQARYRLALTATPFMRDDEEANMRLTAAFGPVGAKVSEQMLIERGILAAPVFKIHDCPAPPLLRRTTRWPSCYELGVVENPERNRLVVWEAGRSAQRGLSTLVLVSRRKHGEALLKMLRDAGLRAAFVFGETDQAGRQRALRDLASGAIQVLIGSTILDVGVDVPAIGTVILAGGGKAEIGFRQRIGRGLRAKKSGPNICHVVDFADRGNKILQTHALTRLEILRATPGFAERVLPEGQDFDWTPFALAA